MAGNRTRYSISISYTDKRGKRRYVNDVGNLWLDEQQRRGTIELPPGVALVGGQANVYINVDLPREREQRGGGRGQGGAQQGFEGGDGDDIPF